MSLGVDDSRIDLDFSKMEAFLNNIWKPFPPFIWCETSEREVLFFVNVFWMPALVFRTLVCMPSRHERFQLLDLF